MICVLQILVAILLFSLPAQAPVVQSVPNTLASAGLGEGQTRTLLLDSGIGTSSEAEIKVVVWLPKTDETVARSLLPKDWEWRIRTGGQSQSGFSAESSRKIVRSEENGLREWYLNLSAKVKAEQGQVYLEERIHEGLDIERYMALTDAAPLQWVRSGATVSLSGYAPGFGDPVLAGTDPVNVQILTRKNERGGETMLALPVLLTEF